MVYRQLLIEAGDKTMLKVCDQTIGPAADGWNAQRRLAASELKIPFSRFVNRLKIKHVLLLNALSEC